MWAVPVQKKKKKKILCSWQVYDASWGPPGWNAENLMITAERHFLKAIIAIRV